MNRQPDHFVDFEHVSVARGIKTVLHDLSLQIARGEHVAILGPNGSGKSTLIKVMTCECYPIARNGSRALIFGKDHWDVFELRKRLGLVAGDIPSETTLGTCGRDAVISGFFASTTIWPGMDVTEDMRRSADIVLDRLEASHLAEKPVGEMSAGEMKRVLIGRALVHDPETLLIDEPSNALDIAAQIELRRTLRQLASQGIGIVLITHHLSDITPEIERVVMLRKGRIFADGPKREMLTAARLSDLFGAQVSVLQQDGHYHVC